MLVIKKYIPLLLVFGLIACSPIKFKEETRPPQPSDAPTQKVGEVLKGWTEGELDIHFINTGRGESTFYVFPDGTTMLVDMAGSLLISSEPGKLPTPARPSLSVSSEEVILNYIKHFTSDISSDHLDYALISHFHTDHMGQYRATVEDSPVGNFKLTAVAKIGTELPYRTLMDRSYPDYTYPNLVNMFDSDNVQNYHKFTAYATSNLGTKMEGFDAGAYNQIFMVNKKADYPTFSIQNLAASGKYWTGEGQNSVLVPPETFTTEGAVPDENCFSCAFLLRYGKFDFYTGGDNQFNGRTGYSYKDSEAPLIPIMPRVDVSKGSHHGTANTNSAEFMNAIRPYVWITHVWREPQPNPATINNVLGANAACDIYLTNLMESNEALMSSVQMQSIKSKLGHVVVRVAEGGATYTVYVLDDGDMNYTIKSVKSYASR